jgi:hypothetical protein
LNFENELLEISALRSLGRITGPDLIAWAVKALTEGYDSPALRRLAGCYADEALADIAPWLERALSELNIMLPTLAPDFRSYSCLLAQAVLDGELLPKLGLKRLAELLYDLPETDRLLYFFLELQDAAEIIDSETEEALCIYPELAQESLENCILAECQLFLAFSQIKDLPTELFLEAICLNCAQQDKPLYRPVPEPWTTKMHRLFAKDYRHQEAHCRHCQSKELLSLSSVAGRQNWLKNRNSSKSHSA